MTPATGDEHQFVDVLEAEQTELLQLLDSIDPTAWELPTPAPGWTVRDQVSHLADTEIIARDTVIDGPRALAKETARLGRTVIDVGVDAGRAMDAAELLGWWRDAAAANRSALRVADVTQRVPWGLGMGWRTFVTARTMEHWAHGLDIRAAVHVSAADTDRLQHIAWLGYNALPYAFRQAGVEVPDRHTLRVEVLGPAGEEWAFGPTDATDTIKGPAGTWCRRAVHRITPEQAEQLVTSGPLAELAVVHARAFL